MLLVVALQVLSLSQAFGTSLVWRTMRNWIVPEFATNWITHWFFISAPVSRTAFAPRTVVFAEEDESGQERGVSVDQDGKSNVWAIEPKMEVSTQSSEEKTKSALIAGGGLAAFVAVAGIALSNLPDPNQF
jgi:hypothetical protein